MDFNDTQEEAAFRAEVKDWLSARVKPRDAGASGFSMFSENESPEMIKDAQRWQAEKADAGWAGITWPKKYGGRGGSFMQQVIWNQEEMKFDTPPNVFMIGIGMAGPTITTHGSEEHKNAFLKPMLRGEKIWCQLFSEPAAGSDLAGLRTRAVKDGDDWIINGQKVWTSGGHYSQWGILVTRSDPEKPKHKGLTYFIVDMSSPGIEIRPIKQITGGANFNEVFFTDVRIPDSNRLGAVGNGWGVAITTLMNERMSIGAGGFGGDFGIKEIIHLAKSREINGKPAIEDAGVRQKIADFTWRMKGLEFVGNRALTAMSRGGMPGPESSIGKLAMGILLQEMAAMAMELQGAGGALFNGDAAQGGLWQDMYLGIPAIRIAGGTDEIQRNIIGERILGLPADVRLDKGIPFSEVATGPRKG